MKIAVMIMATRKEPSLRNVTGMLETFIKHTDELASSNKLQNEYTFYIYDADPELPEQTVEYGQFGSIHVYHKTYKMDESVYLTYEKSYRMFEDVSNKYDFYVRINISTYLNIELLDNVVSQMEDDSIYCSAINAYVDLNSAYANEVYARGDLMIFSDKVLCGLLDNGKDLLHCDRALESDRLSVPHVDDCLIGIAFIRWLGASKYYEHLKAIYYNFFPYDSVDMSAPNFSKAIGNRLKTIPPHESYSGYSWEDNDFRKYDVVKMHTLYSLYDSGKHYAKKLETIIVPSEDARKALFIFGKQLEPIEFVRRKNQI